MGVTLILQRCGTFDARVRRILRNSLKVTIPEKKGVGGGESWGDRVDWRQSGNAVICCQWLWSLDRVGEGCGKLSRAPKGSRRVVERLF